MKPGPRPDWTKSEIRLISVASLVDTTYIYIQSQEIGMDVSLIGMYEELSGMQLQEEENKI